MRCQFLVVLLLCMVFSPAALGQTEGRAPPGCSESNISDISNSLSLDAGLCWKMNLGTLQPGDVFEIEINIINDAIDILFFDQSTIQSYDLGQSYRSQFDSKSSFENASGGYTFHWKVPASINPKTWYLVLDNLAHDGDQGFGDQGGATSQISLDFTKLQDSFWTPFHDVLSVPAQSHQTLLSGNDLKLDSGTTIVLTAWALEGVADVYLQTKEMHDLYVSGGVGQLYITTTEMQSITDSDSTTWVVPNELEGEELVLIVDNTDNPVGGGDGSQDIRITVRVQLAPPIEPQISVANSGITSIGVGLDLDSMATPNLLGQIDVLSWDFDDSIDEDGDGIFDNDADQEGWQAVGVWDSPGQKVVTLTATSKDSQTAKTDRTITVQDTVSPTAVISSSGQIVSGGWKTNLNQEIPFSCSGSTDDDEVVSCSWTLDGEFYDDNSTISLSWSNIGNHILVLTVQDPAGNSDSISKNILVDDNSIPDLDQSKLELLPNSGVEGEALKFIASATDSYDQSYQLTYHWDLDPNTDSDMNGNSNDDPDYVGSEVEITFEQTGRIDVVLTVFDQSGNSDTHPFSVNVAAESEPTGIFAFLMVILFVGTVTMAISMIGYRRWQGKIALELLLGRGLSEPEAREHIRMVSQKMKVPIFASASVIAGLEINQPTESSQEKEERAKQAQYESIYGSSQQDPNAGFAPQTNSFQPTFRQVSQGSQTAAADALAMFAEEETETIIESRNIQHPEKVIETKVNSGGIELPQNIKNRISKSPTEEPIHEPKQTVDDSISITCPECNHQFGVKAPEGVDRAVVACPACNIDFGIEFG